MFAQVLDVVVHPQPLILGIEPELSTHNTPVEFESETLIKSPGSPHDLELGKERIFAIDDGAEGPLIKVGLGDDLPKLTVSSLAQNDRRVS